MLHTLEMLCLVQMRYCFFLLELRPSCTKEFALCVNLDRSEEIKLLQSSFGLSNTDPFWCSYHFTDLIVIGFVHSCKIEPVFGCKETYHD